MVAVVKQQIPDEICGDLDSIREEVKEYYKERGVIITHMPSQDETDFMKCVRRIGLAYDVSKNRRDDDAGLDSSSSGTDNTSSSTTTRRRFFDIMVLGGLGGRVDQAFSIVQQLYNHQPDRSRRPTWPHGTILLFSEENVSFVLNPGRNVIFASSKDRRAYLGRNVGILPVGRPAVVTTKGLEWDVTDWQTEFGKQVSTSNHLTGEGDVVVEITTDVAVLFTLERSLTFPDCVCCP